MRGRLTLQGTHNYIEVRYALFSEPTVRFTRYVLHESVPASLDGTFTEYSADRCLWECEARAPNGKRYTLRTWELGEDGYIALQPPKVRGAQSVTWRSGRWEATFKRQQTRTLEVDIWKL